MGTWLVAVATLFVISGIFLVAMYLSIPWFVNKVYSLPGPQILKTILLFLLVIAMAIIWPRIFK